MFDRARRGDLTDAWKRLEQFGADAELVRLARSCLAPAAEGRPRDAAAVAASVTAYQALGKAHLLRDQAAAVALTDLVIEPTDRMRFDEQVR